MTDFKDFATALLAPFTYLFKSDERIFLPWMVIALCLTLWVGLRRGQSTKEALRDFFSLRVWWSPSARVDYALFMTNQVVKLFVRASFLLPMALVAALVSLCLELFSGGALLLDAPRWLIGGLYSIGLFLVGDLSRYLLHRALHRWPVLWAFHRVHHSATSLNPLSVYRVHPVESFLFGLRGVVATGFITGVFMWLFGTRLNGWDILGVNAIGLLFNALGANLRHSPIWLSYGPFLEKHLISPAQHQLHHSEAPQHYDCNFGTCLAIWDRLGGSLELAAEHDQDLRFGLGLENAQWEQRWTTMILKPFAEIRWGHRAALGSTALVALLVGGGFFFTACTQNAAHNTAGNSSKVETETPEPKSSLTLYSGRSQVLIEDLLQTFTKESGIEVKVRYDKSTQALASRLAAEGQKTEADLFFAQTSGYLGALGHAGHLRPLPEDILNVVPANSRSAAGHWVGISGRARVLVYDPSTITEEELPDSLKDLADKKWHGRLGWAPGNASLQAHISALRVLWGEEETERWLTKMKSVEPRRYPKNSPQVKGVSNGEIGIGWVNHYYLHKLKSADPSLRAANYSFRSPKDAGNLMMLSGIGITAASKQYEDALLLVRFLLSKKSQTYFTDSVFEYPVREDVKPHRDLGDIRPQMAAVDQVALADMGPTLELLSRLQLK